jgi:glycerol uptake facilitator protein
MGAKFFGEFMGTLVLILLGNGVVANVSLRHSKAEGAGWMAIAAGWAFAVMAGSLTATACGSPDSHLNPAMTLGMAIRIRRFLEGLALPRGAASRRRGRSDRRVAPFSAALEGDR